MRNEPRRRRRDRVNFVLEIDLPRHEPVADAEAYLQEAVAWHFGAETGSRFWLEQAKKLDFNPLTDIKTHEDLRRFPNLVDELRYTKVADLIPQGYGPHPPTPVISESGGTTGAPKRIIMLPDWIEHVSKGYMCRLLCGLENEVRGILAVVPTGPHMVGYLWNEQAKSLNVPCFTVDLDPCWVKKLIARGASAETEAYTEHLTDQVEFLLRTQDVDVVVTTPPILQSIAARDELVEIVNEKVRLISLAGTHITRDTRDFLRTVIFPSAVFGNQYGNTMILGGNFQREGQGEDEEPIFDTLSPSCSLWIVDPETGQDVPYGERGQVVMNHISKNMFMPNNLERDTAIRVPGPAGQVGDSASVIRPVGVFEGEDVIEGVY